LLNNVVLIGRLVRDPDLRYSPSGTAVANFTLAVDRAFKNEDGEKEADFIPVVVFKKQAENCANYLKKGRLVAIEGRIQVRTYEDKDGNKRWVTEVIAHNVRFLESGKKKESENTSPLSGGEEVNFSDNQIPF
jgi:single-strand DNA-binding protein